MKKKTCPKTCPNCKAPIKQAAVCINGIWKPDYYTCGSSYSVNYRKPLVRCTEGEKSGDWKATLEGEDSPLVHNLFNCSETYARAYIRENFRSPLLSLTRKD